MRRRTLLAWPLVCGRGSATPAKAWALVRISGGRPLEQHGAGSGEPGSTAKPLLATLFPESERYPCPGPLSIAGRRLDCTHPLLGPADLESALAFSCNNWFARMAQRLDGGAIRDTLRSFGLPAQDPRTADEKTLLSLGLWGVEVTPLQLARAYARLSKSASPEVRRGLARAVDEGTASSAQPPGLRIAGKTGTVVPHAWFAGWAPRDNPEVALAVYVSSGRGMTDAAPAAREVLSRWLERRGR